MERVRGRRPGTTPAGHGQSAEPVIAWLLRVNRLYGDDERLAVAARFARAYDDGDVTASESQVCRWERATLRLSAPVIGRYERVLGLPRGRLAAVAHTLYRESRGCLGPPALRPTGNADAMRDRLSPLLERALGAEEMTGCDWDELTAGLWEVPVLLHPRRLWPELIQRLLAELLVAEGTGWLWRCEALNRLLGLRDGATAVVEACAAVIDDRRSQVLIEPAALLEMTPHPAAAAYLLGQVENPVSDQVLRAAWWAVAEKTGRGHFDPGQLRRLTQVALETLRDSGSPLASRVGAAETARQLLPDVSAGEHRALSQALQGDPVSGHVLRSGTVAAPETVHAVAHRLSQAVLSLMRREILQEDPVLERLIADMLFHPQGTRRTVAAQTVAATPYRSVLADVMGRELGRPGMLTSAPLATALVQAIGHLGGAEEAALIWRLVLGRGLPAPVQEAAAWIVGHLHVPSERWDVVRTRLLHHRDGPLPGYVRGLMYSAGVSRRNADLTELSGPQVHPELRTAASWWLSIPDFVRASALV
ncbi:hypothetical protein Cs7R123_05970 [Catellatospora sp. TT07R-123]|uniref:hypothetical protein n=1 Tax=Catellatospora sp. TT07R-123 TaxID=2733863 RepID=UPI001B1DD9B4|nr:hypothetical protein [Catellatospora sp. TT07R-123]GHJ43255.1 hypothetical protein Cs7R123_05970 [Catellatospora sp. TT07R-123]